MATIIFAGDEQQRSPKIAEFLNGLLRDAGLPEVTAHHALYADPFENLDDVLERLSEDEWSEPCIIALDVKYPTSAYGGVTTVYDGIVKQYGSIPAKHVVWYSVFLAQEGPERDEIVEMANERGVEHLAASGVGNDLLGVAKVLFPLVRDCV